MKRVLDNRITGPQLGYGLGILLLSLVGLGFFKWASMGPAPRALFSLTFGAYAGDTGVLAWIAKEQGFFQKAGLEVTLKGYKAGKFAVNALVADQVDLANSADFVLTRRSFAHTDLQVLATVAFSRTYRIIGHRDREIETPQDLIGKRVGLTQGTSGEYMAGHFLLRHGISLDQVTLVNLRPTELLAALQEDRIDAVSSWGTYVYAIKEQLGDQGVLFTIDESQGSYFLLLAKRNWIDTHAEQARRIVQAFVWAADYARQYRDEAIAAMIKRFDYLPDYGRYIWDQHTYRVEMPQALLSSMEEQARWLLQNRLISPQPIPNMLLLLRPEIMNAVHRTGVSLVE